MEHVYADTFPLVFSSYIPSNLKGNKIYADVQQKIQQKLKNIKI